MSVLCNLPDGTIEQGLAPVDPIKTRFFAASGITSIIDHMLLHGYNRSNYDYYDINSLHPSDDILIDYFIDKSPDVVGLSGPLSHCYPAMKRVASIIRSVLPNCCIVAGGHITSTADVILEKTDVDICVVGDGEIAWLKLLEYIEKGQFLNLKEINPEHIVGLSYLKDGEIIFTGYGEQLDSSELRLTNYDIIEIGLQDRKHWMKYFFTDIEEFSSVIRFVGDNEDVKNLSGFVLQLPTSKGCVARCTFCQRYTKGYRKYNLEKLESYAIKMKEKYNIGIVHVTDENFGSNVKQAIQFSEVMKKLNLYWSAGGVRCRTFSKDHFKILKNNNCFYLKFGIESGSQKILDIMEKIFKTDDILEAIKNVNSVGIYTNPDALMLGMPGENRSTVMESARFIAKLRYTLNNNYIIGDPFWAIAIPGTPLYEYGVKIGIISKNIDNKEKYLYELADTNVRSMDKYLPFNNAKNSESFFWNTIFRIEGKRAYINNIFKNEKHIYNMLSKLYKMCLAPEIKNVQKALLKKRGNMAKVNVIVQFIITMISMTTPRFFYVPFNKFISNFVFFRKRWIYNKKGVKNFFTHETKRNKKYLIDSIDLTGKRKKEKSLRSFVNNDINISTGLFKNEVALSSLMKGR